MHWVWLHNPSYDAISWANKVLRPCSLHGTLAQTIQTGAAALKWINTPTSWVTLIFFTQISLTHKFEKISIPHHVLLNRNSFTNADFEKNILTDST